ncbi:hypothetical protein C8F01DRAFT_282567 [Mycena amicta]|nr:hypothetical protein C8F01DRAFT_282567 [Mycena amicta]
MSAAARAEARRKAILSRGTDRLAKLTTSSGRTEDLIMAVPTPTPPTGQGNNEASSYPDPPVPSFAETTGTATGRFVGEETFGMPRPRPHSASPSPQRPLRSSAAAEGDFFGLGAGASAGMNAEAAQMQAQLMQALMGGAGVGGDASNPFLGMGMGNGMANGNPLAALMSAAGAQGGGAGVENNAMPMPMAPPPPKTRLQRVLPAVHMLAVWALVLYFVLVREPAAHLHSEAEGSGLAWRWSRLLGKGNDRSSMAGVPIAWAVQIMPFFWAFVTLELALHSLRIFSGFDAFRPPTLLALVLPSLPAPIPSIIVHGMKYFQMGSMFLDDVAAVIVGLGLVIWLATWLAA